jgi:hypothetical protein
LYKGEDSIAARMSKLNGFFRVKKLSQKNLREDNSGKELYDVYTYPKLIKDGGESINKLGEIVVAHNEHMLSDIVIQLAQIRVVNLDDNNAVQLEKIDNRKKSKKIETDPKSEVEGMIEQGTEKEIKGATSEGDSSNTGSENSSETDEIVPEPEEITPEITTDLRTRLFSAVANILEKNGIKNVRVEANKIVSDNYNNVRSALNDISDIQAVLEQSLNSGYNSTDVLGGLLESIEDEIDKIC